MGEGWYEPENRTKCEYTESGKHEWVWDEEQEDYQCDNCGIWHDSPEHE